MGLGTIGIWLPFIIGAWENRLRSSGMALLTLRKLMTLGGAAIQVGTAIRNHTQRNTPLTHGMARTSAQGFCRIGAYSQ
jgi:hypothetical protein